MANEMTLFGGKGNSLVNPDMFEKLSQINKNLMSSGGSSMRRISVRGGRFRQIVGGEQIAVSKETSMNVVIVNAAALSRTFYSGTYDPEKIVPPTCWSSDTQRPDPSVPDDQKQSDRCVSCPQNVKGSGQGESRACRYSQRIAVVMENNWDEVYQFQLAATSIFGDAENGKMPMAAYARYLEAHKTPSIAIVTEMYFDENSDVPKLFFKPVRPLEEEELAACIEASESDDARRAVELTVSQTDGVQPIASDKPETKKAPAKKAPAKKKAEQEQEEGDDDEGDVEPPKKSTRSKAKAAEPDEDEGPASLSDLISDWDD